jgi:thiol:disulfide interchange protein
LGLTFVQLVPYYFKKLHVLYSLKLTFSELASALNLLTLQSSTTRMKKALIIFSASALLMAITAMTFIEKPPAEGTVKWITFEEAVKKSKVEKRPVFIDVYTDWCGWCKVMDKNTFNDPEVATLLNEKFYAVKFDAEQKEDVVFNGTTFKFVPSGSKGYHQLAAALLNNQLS